MYRCSQLKYIELSVAPAVCSVISTTQRDFKLIQKTSHYDRPPRGTEKRVASIIATIIANSFTPIVIAIAAASIAIATSAVTIG